jgi:hypothetical protein
MLAAEVLAWLPERSRAECVLRMPQSWIERHFEELPIRIKDIFFQRTWSLKFLERVLPPEATDLWDHVSAWYDLTDSFCERNIDWLNFHDLVYSQNLSREFYISNADRIDWIANPVDRRNLFERFYKKSPE